jgi:hypothetical protein
MNPLFNFKNEPLPDEVMYYNERPPADVGGLLAALVAPSGPARDIPRRGQVPPWGGMDYAPSEYTLAAMMRRSASRADRPVLGDPMYRQQRYGPFGVPAVLSMQPGLFPFQQR